MSEKKLRALFAILLLGASALLGVIIFVVVNLLNGAKLLPTAASVYLAFLAYLGSVLLSLGISVTVNARANLVRTKAWLRSLFGSDEQYVEDDAALLGKLNRLRKKAEDGTVPLLLGLAVKTNAGGTLNSLGTAFTYSVNELLLERVKAAFGLDPTFHLFIDHNNNYILYFNASNVDDQLDSFRKFAFTLTESIERRDDIPYVAFLLSAHPIEAKEKPSDALEKTIFALWHNASSRISCDLLVYDQSMLAENARMKELDSEITRALANEELVIYYQAKYSLKKNAFYGAEALIRWKHPKRGLLPPAVFIPYCENSGKIVEIDHYVFEHVCADIEKWNKEKRRKVVISVNLSRRSVYDPSLISFLSDTMKKHNVDPTSIDMELTESLAANNTVFISSIIRKVKGLGFATSIDDFGVGYSSLSSLKNIPFDVLKIDKSFVDDVEVDAKSKAMVLSIISLAHALGMKVIAEGVETEHQSDILRSLDLDSIQGYYYSRPSDRAHFEAYLEDNPFEKKESPKRKEARIAYDPIRR